LPSAGKHGLFIPYFIDAPKPFGLLHGSTSRQGAGGGMKFRYRRRKSGSGELFVSETVGKKPQSRKISPLVCAAGPAPPARGRRPLSCSAAAAALRSASAAQGAGTPGLRLRACLPSLAAEPPAASPCYGGEPSPLNFSLQRIIIC